MKPSGGKKRALKTLPLDESLTEGDVWFFHRIAASGKYGGSGLYEIMNLWTLKDCQDAHLVLDAFLDVESEVPEARAPDDDRTVRLHR